MQEIARFHFSIRFSVLLARFRKKRRSRSESGHLAVELLCRNSVNITLLPTLLQTERLRVAVVVNLSTLLLRTKYQTRNGSQLSSPPCSQRYFESNVCQLWLSHSGQRYRNERSIKQGTAVNCLRHLASNVTSNRTFVRCGHRESVNITAMNEVPNRQTRNGSQPSSSPCPQH